MEAKTSGPKRVALTLSDDEEKQDCMPKIINTISLQGCSNLSFKDEPEEEEDMDSILYPECEIKEEKPVVEDITDIHDPRENGHTSDHKKTGFSESETKKEKKKLKLTHLTNIKHESRPRSKPSTSRRDEYNVVDARKLALQESLFKTKELFDTFLRVCQDQENSEEMDRAVNKLIRAYGLTRQEFLGSLAFQNILESETEKVNTSNTKPWLNLKLVLDEMKHNKKLAVSKLKLGESEDSQGAKSSEEDESIIECPKKRRHLKKLEKTLRAINLKIKKLEEKEVDLDDDDSAYIKLDRYRTQFTRCYNKVCEIKGKLPDADRPYLRKVSFAGTTYPHINRCIERYYNKHREFPDFQDIKKLVTIANQQEKIDMPPVKVHQMAAAAFKEFGEMLKRLRQYDDYDVIISYLDQQVDPAKDNEELQEELNKNALLFKKKEQEVFDKFAAEDVGIHSFSEGNSDSKKRKKRKIIIMGPKKKPANKHLSSGESSDEGKEKEPSSAGKEKENPGTCLNSDSSSSSSSGSEAESVKEEPVGGKGKAIIGKKRIVKRGTPRNLPRKVRMPKTAISSSDEESVPENNKDTLTNYLGLQGTILKTEKPKIKEESDEDEITCVQEIKRSPQENNVPKKNISDKNSDNDSIEKTKLPLVMDVSDKTDSSESDSGTSKKPNKQQNNSKVTNNVEDSNSDIETVAVTEKRLNPINKAKSRFKPKLNSVPPRNSTLKKIKPQSSISDNSTGDRTSDEESDSSVAKKTLSDVELSTGTKELSSDSSDSEGSKKKVNKSDADDAIVILSEDIIEETRPADNKPASKKSLSASNSDDDVCFLAESEVERRTIAPRKIRPSQNTGNVSTQRSLSSFSIPPRRRQLPATSTPVEKPRWVTKRRLSNQSSSGSNNKKPRRCDLPSGVNGRQSTLPQMINGAARKTIISRVCKPTNSKPSPEPNKLIELIELD